MVETVPPNPEFGSNNGGNDTVDAVPVSSARRRVTGENGGAERSQIQQDGAFIYRDFLNAEFQRRNLPNPGQYFGDGAVYHSLSNPSPDLNRAIEQLRVVSGEFARTPMRAWVEQYAAQVPLEQLDFQAFSQILFGLFQEGGVTWERIVVLFYFCTDLAARAVRESVPLRFQSIVEWSFLFFSSDRMIQWVFLNGGWLAALQNSVNKAYRMTKLVAYVMGVLALGVFWWKSGS